MGNCTESDLRHYFSQFGFVRKIEVYSEPLGSFCFVCFTSVAQAKAAFEAGSLMGHMISKRKRLHNIGDDTLVVCYRRHCGPNQDQVDATDDLVMDDNEPSASIQQYGVDATDEIVMDDTESSGSSQQRGPKKYRELFIPDTGNYSPRNIKLIFEEYGRVTKVTVNPRRNGIPFGFVCFESVAQATATFEAGEVIPGRKERLLNVKGQFLLVSYKGEEETEDQEPFLDRRLYVGGDVSSVGMEIVISYFRKYGMVKSFKVPPKSVKTDHCEKFYITFAMAGQAAAAYVDGKPHGNYRQHVIGEEDTTFDVSLVTQVKPQKTKKGTIPGTPKEKIEDKKETTKKGTIPGTSKEKDEESLRQRGLFVGGDVHVVGEEALKAYFEKFGTVEAVDVPWRAKGTPYYYRFIKFASVSEATAAYEAGTKFGKYRKHCIAGNVIKVGYISSNEESEDKGKEMLASISDEQKKSEDKGKEKLASVSDKQKKSEDKGKEKSGPASKEQKGLKSDTTSGKQEDVKKVTPKKQESTKQDKAETSEANASSESDEELLKLHVYRVEKLSKEDLQSYFSKYGTVTDITLLKTFRSRFAHTYGYVKFESADEASAAYLGATRRGTVMMQKIKDSWVVLKHHILKPVPKQKSNISKKEEETVSSTASSEDPASDNPSTSATPKPTQAGKETVNAPTPTSKEPTSEDNFCLQITTPKLAVLSSGGFCHMKLTKDIRTHFSKYGTVETVRMKKQFIRFATVDEARAAYKDGKVDDTDDIGWRRHYIGKRCVKVFPYVASSSTEQVDSSSSSQQQSNKSEKKKETSQVAQPVSSTASSVDTATENPSTSAAEQPTQADKETSAVNAPTPTSKEPTSEEDFCHQVTTPQLTMLGFCPMQHIITHFSKYGTVDTERTSKELIHFASVDEARAAYKDGKVVDTDDIGWRRHYIGKRCVKVFPYVASSAAKQVDSSSGSQQKSTISKKRDNSSTSATAQSTEADKKTSAVNVPIPSCKKERTSEDNLCLQVTTPQLKLMGQCLMKDIKRYFSKYGTVRMVQIKKQLIHFASVDEARAAYKDGKVDPRDDIGWRRHYIRSRYVFNTDQDTRYVSVFPDVASSAVKQVDSSSSSQQTSDKSEQKKETSEVAQPVSSTASSVDTTTDNPSTSATEQQTQADMASINEFLRKITTPELVIIGRHSLSYEAITTYFKKRYGPVTLFTQAGTSKHIKFQSLRSARAAYKYSKVDPSDDIGLGRHYIDNGYVTVTPYVAPSSANQVDSQNFLSQITKPELVIIGEEFYRYGVIKAYFKKYGTVTVYAAGTSKHIKFSSVNAARAAYQDGKIHATDDIGWRRHYIYNRCVKVCPCGASSSTKQVDSSRSQNFFESQITKPELVIIGVKNYKYQLDIIRYFKKYGIVTLYTDAGTKHIKFPSVNAARAAYRDGKVDVSSEFGRLRKHYIGNQCVKVGPDLASSSGTEDNISSSNQKHQVERMRRTLFILDPHGLDAADLKLHFDKYGKIIDTVLSSTPDVNTMVTFDTTQEAVAAYRDGLQDEDDDDVRKHYIFFKDVHIGVKFDDSIQSEMKLLATSNEYVPEEMDMDDEEIPGDITGATMDVTEHDEIEMEVSEEEASAIKEKNSKQGTEMEINITEEETDEEDTAEMKGTEEDDRTLYITKGSNISHLTSNELQEYFGRYGEIEKAERTPAGRLMVRFQSASHAQDAYKDGKLTSRDGTSKHFIDKNFVEISLNSSQN
ncbi:uncharacterized protein [Amphiura filiformis]|uniref:uncharacterized protein n=1 Tax=Amphiura filiformis TaxID=82378 RepID=UPI003B21AD01